MSLTLSFPYVNTPAFYTGTSLSSLVPDVFPVAINGRPYIIDQRSNQFTRAFEQRVRDSVDQSTAPGEAAINPGGLWRRGEVSWHLGAGQKYADTAEGQDYRFYKSKGVNPWVKGQLTLLNATKSALTTSSTNLMTCVVKSGGVEYVYVADGAVVRWCPATGANNIFSSTPSWTAITTNTAGGSVPATTVTGLETNGSNVFIAWENNDIWSSAPGTTSATFFYATNPDNGRTYYAFGYAKGRGWAAHGANIHQPAVTSPTHSIYYGPNSPAYDPSRVWVGFAGGQNAVYAASYIGDKTTIFKITIKTDGTLDVPVAALELPTGEVASSIHGYLGAIVIGTNKGVRYCTTDSNSNLISGALIPTSGPVYDFTADDRFLWFTWSNYDGTSGLGRLDLSVFISANTPAHATDLMYSSSNDVKSVSSVGGKRIFTISGVGVIVEDTANLVASGSIESGIYRWGIPDRKFIARVDTRSTPLIGSIESYMSLDAEEYTQLGTWSGTGDTENSFNGSDDHAIEAQFKFVLNRATVTTGPTFTRWAARAYAAPYRSEVFRVPVILHEKIRVHEQDYFFDVNEELGALRELINKPRIVTLQIRDETVSVIVEDMEWTPVDSVDKDWLWQGTATVTMRSVQE